MSIESVFKGMVIVSAFAAGGVIAASYAEDKCSEGPDKLVQMIAIGCIGCVAGGGVGYLVTRPKVYNGIYDITARILRSIKIDFVIFPKSWIQVRIPICN